MCVIFVYGKTKRQNVINFIYYNLRIKIAVTPLGFCISLIQGILVKKCVKFKIVNTQDSLVLDEHKIFIGISVLDIIWLKIRSIINAFTM